MGILRAIGTGVGIGFCLFALGCGDLVVPLDAPNISQVLPQRIAAGSKTQTMKVVGTNFTNSAVILWNGNTLATSVVDSNTLVGTVESSSLAVPAVVQLRVQNRQTGRESQSMPVTVASAGVNPPVVGAPSATSAPALTISTTKVPAGTVGSRYGASLAAAGGTPGYTWSIASGELPPGVSLNASTGALSGTPTGNGSFSFVATVTDAGLPAQSTSLALTVLVAAQRSSSAQLAILPGALPSAMLNKTYSGTMSATGGTGPYTWSIASGSLPRGLTLASSTGVISGTLMVGDTFSFTVRVTDAGKPAQTASAMESISVAANRPGSLTITTLSLPSGSDGTAYARALQASGGTPAYTWSITAGSLPSGLTLAATTGVISGTPAVTGTSSFTATVRDNGSPAQTRSVTISLTVSPAQLPTGPGTTWYVRADGGTRYSANVPTGQCDGQADAAYSGTGTNQHCAFNDFRYLWDDNSGQVGQGAWVIAGGDTVIVSGCAALPGQQNPDGTHCRIGWDKSTSSGPDTNWCYAVGSYGCFNPPVPSGTALRHTRILGRNYASCNTGGATNPKLYASNLTQIFGGFSVLYTLNLQNTSYVDVQCLEITQHNGVCTRVGAPAYPRGCNSSQPLDDYATGGILTNNATSNITMQDVYIHGFNSTGLFGPIGGPITMTRMFVGFNTFAGWNFDDGHSTPDAPGSSIAANHVIMEGNGCQEQYPIVNDFPAMVCYDSNSGGFGDSWSGQNTTLDSFTCNDCQNLYNTKDGFIGPHTWVTNLSITNSVSIGNMGQNWKWGGNAVPTTVDFTNNLTVGNCYRMSQPLPGAPANYNQYLTGFCRAAGMVMGSVISKGSTWTIANNTWVTYQPTSFYIACPGQVPGPCPSTINFKNNIFLGYLNPSQPTGNAVPALYLLNDPSIHKVATNNVEFGMRNGDCQNGGSGNICLDPQLVGEPAQGAIPAEAALDNFNFAPTTVSPVIGAGTTYSALPSTDYLGRPTSSPPVIGAIEP